MKKALLTFTAFGFPGAALAHPGHPGGETVSHWLSMGDHLGVVSVALLAAVAAAVWKGRQND